MAPAPMKPNFASGDHRNGAEELMGRECGAQKIEERSEMKGYKGRSVQEEMGRNSAREWRVENADITQTKKS
jgi:hypothetical protein